jgi:acyl carrier protein
MSDSTTNPRIAALQGESLTDMIRAFTAEHLRMEFGDITADAHFRDDLGLDYLDVIELAILLEKEFANEDTFDESDDIEFVSDLISHIEKSLKQSQYCSDGCRHWSD